MPSAAPSDSPVPIASADPTPPACSGTALTQRVFTGCPGRPGPNSAPPPSKLAFSASTQKVTIAQGQSVEVTFTLKNTDSAPQTVVFEVPADAGLPTYVHSVSPLDIELAPPRLDLECISGSGPVAKVRPPQRMNHAVVELLPNGTLTWTRRIDAMEHGWVMDKTKLVGFTGSGTPCMESSMPVAKGDRRIVAPSFVQGVPGVPIDVTVR